MSLHHKHDVGMMRTGISQTKHTSPVRDVEIQGIHSNVFCMILISRYTASCPEGEKTITQTNGHSSMTKVVLSLSLLFLLQTWLNHPQIQMQRHTI